MNPAKAGPQQSPEALSPETRTLRANSISPIEVIMSGLVQVAPASSVILTTALMAGLAGASVPLVFLLAMVGVLCTGNSLVQFSRIWPSSGSFVTYISRAVGPRTGLATAIIALLGYMIAYAGIYLFVGRFIATQLFRNESDLFAILCAVIFGLLVLIPVVVGVQVGLRLAVLLYVVEVAVVMVISVSIILQGGDHGLTAEPFSFEGTSFEAVAGAFSLAVLGFVGFEAPAPLAEESENPRRNVPIGIFVGIFVSGLIFVVASYAGIIAFSDSQAYANDPSPFTTATQNFIPLLGGVIEALFLSSIIASYIIANSQTARVIFSGARGGLWPRGLSRIHPRFKTPWLAALAFVLPSLGLAVVAALISPLDLATVSGFLSTWGTLGIILMYVMTNISLVSLWARERRRGTKRSVFGWVVVPAVGTAVMAIPIWSSLQGGQAAPFDLLVWFFVLMILIGIGYALWFSWRRPELIKNAAALAMGEVTRGEG